LRLTIPNGSATIVIQARSEGGSSIDDVLLALRFNGRVFPPAVRELMQYRRGMPLATAVNGSAVFHRMPIGLYEFWPYRSARELSAIHFGSAAPVRLAAAAGENQVDLTFSPRKP
jgi:hypothetical protein